MRMNYPDAVLITGANGQTAIQIARTLIKNRCTVLLLFHERRDRIDKLIEQYPDNCYVASCDLSSYQETEQKVKELIRQAGVEPLGLVHAAAVRSYDARTLFEGEPEVWRSIFESNMAFAYNALRCTLPMMADKMTGKVVMLGSNVTRTGLPKGSAYAASKAAMANLVRSTALEMAHYNIQINQVSPAPVITILSEDYEGDYLTFREKYFSDYIARHPAHQLVSIPDVVQVVLSLLRMDVSMQSGEEIFITGGVL